MTHSSQNNGFFWHEKLDVFHLALEFSRWVHRVGPKVPRGRSHIRDQLNRASDSVVLNICEGAAYPGKAGRNYFRIALRSIGESHGAICLLEILGVPDTEAGFKLAHGIRARLGGLAR